MSGFELEPVDGGISIPLPEGETQLGRGPFLGVSDKRVSRHHGLLEISDGQLRIKPTHQNPCFYQPSLGDPPEPLEKDRWHILQHGNLFSLLPGKYIYRVVTINSDDTQRNSQVLEQEEHIADVPSTAAIPEKEQMFSPELNGQSEPTKNDTQNRQAESVSFCSRGREEDNIKMEAITTKVQELRSREPSPKPEQRKRVLPAWMMHIASDASSPSTSTGDRKRGRGKAPPSRATKPRPRKARNRSISSEESELSEVEQAQKKRAKRLKSEEEEEEDTQSNVVELGDACQGRLQAVSDAKTTMRPHISESGEVSDDSEEGSSMGRLEGQRNGRRAPENRPPERRGGADVKDEGEKESQSQGKERVKGGLEVSSVEGAPSASRAGPSHTKAKAPSRPPCPYGKNCYRKNPVHFQECSHPGDSDYTEGEEEEKDEDDDRPECPYGTSCYRKNLQHKKEYKHTQDPGKKGRLDDDDEVEGEEDERDDDSFINDDSGDLDEDSDYVPPDSEDEDIQRLKKEAKAFLKRKR